MLGTVLRATSFEDTIDPAFDGPLVVPLRHVLAVADPRVGDPWGIGDFTAQDVLDQIRCPGVCECTEPPGPGVLACRSCNLARVAWFVQHGLDPNDPQPISLDVGVGEYLPEWPLDDGNHRVAAAAVRGDELVVVQVAGDWDRAIALLVEGRELSDVLDDEAVHSLAV